MTLIVDASVAIKWYVGEPLSDLATELLSRPDLSAPSLIFAEVGNALWKRIRRGASTIEQATAALERLAADLATIESTTDLSAQAMRFAAELDHPIYDCFYLALAHRENAPIVTADRKLAWHAGQTFGELYDLAADPHERVNHWDDAAYAADKARLLSRLMGYCEGIETSRRVHRYCYA